MKWTNNRFHRRLCWFGIMVSPHFALMGRKPTFKEAWSGIIKKDKFHFDI